ncbi:PRC-barrel domain-containing protein [Sphingosinicella rhizophila]|uniref:PRC-barrel domain-containing protein n=1 Tax=Sphingosinicella rhizophila TaxID=3050082 RepID=A0ABU3Q9S7_9SPHN|nr:PRC-barrel domain-containing protein [Sphingosinicella sp. GR2756]MDT9600142.1 PRC-barrel domain-containing protein [Sphingosinicella sp. GR2756]
MEMTKTDAREDPGAANSSAKSLDAQKQQMTWNWSRIGLGVGAAAAIAGVALAGRKVTRHDGDDSDFQYRLETDENVRLISSRKVEGTRVVNRNGTKIGSIDSFMVDKYSGRVAYAVMRFGGSFGFGTSLFPLPWLLLDYDEAKGGYMLDITKEDLEEAPRFESDDQPEFSPEYRQRVILFYRPVNARNNGSTGGARAHSSASYLPGATASGVA